VSKKTMKKLTLVCAAVAALALAGAGGAVIRYTIFTIKPSHYARLAGTDVYCLNQDSQIKSLARFYCGRRTNAARNDGWAYSNAVEVYPHGLDALVCPRSGTCFSPFDHFFPKVKLQKPGH
jgi:hypothetical protein